MKHQEDCRMNLCMNESVEHRCGYTCTCTPIESPEEKHTDGICQACRPKFLEGAECKGTCEVDGGWEEEFDKQFGGVKFKMVVDLGGENDIVDMKEEIALFLRSELAKARQEERTQLLKEVGEKAEKLIEQIRETDLAIRKSDKTPKYEYSHQRCDANRDGEFPEAGARWAMPYELSNGLLRNAEDYLSAVKEILTANK